MEKKITIEQANEIEANTTEILTARHSNAKLAEARQAIDAYFANPTDETQDLVVTNSRGIHELMRMVKDYTDALADLKARIDFAVLELYDYSPELQEQFKLKAGAKSIKCDANEHSMWNLMEAWIKEGYSPEGLFSLCTPITAKKAANAFGLSEEAFLEKYGHLFETHVNKPSVQMAY